MIKLVFLLFLSMWDKSCFVNMHHFLRRSCFLFKLLAWAALILVRHAAAETGTVLEGLGGFLLLLLFLDTWNAILILRFLPRWVLNPLPTGRFEIGTHTPPAKKGGAALCWTKCFCTFFCDLNQVSHFQLHNVVVFSVIGA